MSAMQYEGTNPNVAGVNRGKPVTSGTATPKLRKASVSPTPNDRSNKAGGK